jgi:hypothetical protein
MKPIEELSRKLEDSRSVLLLACNGCEESFGNAEPERLKKLSAELGEKRISNIEILSVDFLCEPILVKHWLPAAGCSNGIDAILVVSCGIGVW